MKDGSLPGCRSRDIELDSYKQVQGVAKHVHSVLGEFIVSASSERSIAESAVQLLLDFGVSETWYHCVPAYVLLGDRSCLSVSGRDYFPTSELVGDLNLVTVDLSPMIGDVWGDCARSYCVENGPYSPEPKHSAFVEGLAVEKELHNRMRQFVSPDTQLNELYEFGNLAIANLGYENLDFLGNLGHSIEQDLGDRKFIDENSDDRLGDVGHFTFEPHIRKRGEGWGFKHENIYYFDSLSELNELWLPSNGIGNLTDEI